MKRTRSKQEKALARGFTLLELVMVLLIAAILVVWGFPSLIQSIQNNAVASQNMSIVSMLNLTKSEAVRRNTNVHMILENTDNGWEAVIEDPNEEAEVAGCVEGQLRCASHENAGLCDEGPGSCPDSYEIVFNNRGYLVDPADLDAWASQTTLFLQHNRCSGQSQRTRIDILPSGQISSCLLPCDSTEACP